MKNYGESQQLPMRTMFFRLMFMLLFVAGAAGAYAQGKVTGKVVDTNGEPIMGASVVASSTNGVTTDIDGNFALSNVAASTVLKVTFIGYVSESVKVGNNKTLRIVLREDAKMLDELVVVGYGSMKKSDLTGAVSRITSKTIEERPVQNALQAMQGKTPGVDITTNNRPGELGDVRIRGNRSLLADNTPLYVIDGIPLTAGSMGDINPSDIESIEILKDASTTAIYGSRGANGVVLITSKKGQKGRVSINYDGSFSWSKLNSTTDYMDAGQLLDYRRQAAINGGTYGGNYGTAPDPDYDKANFIGTEAWCDRVIRTAFAYNADGTVQMRAATEDEKKAGYAAQVPVYNSANMLNTDWGDLVTRTAFTNTHQLSLSAGSEKSKLYISFGYLNQNVPVKDQDYERFTVNINGEIAPTDWLNVGLALNGSHAIKNYGIVSNFDNTVAKDSYGLAMNTMPWVPCYNEDGTYLVGTTNGQAGHNIVADITESQNEYRYYGLNLSSFFEVQLGKLWQPLEGLKWRTNFGTQFRHTRYGSFYNEGWSNVYGFDSTEALVGYNNQSTNMSWTLENLLYYDKEIGDHRFGATLMQSAEKYRTEGINIRAYNVVYPTSMWYDLGNSNRDKASYGTNYSNWTRSSYMARLKYSLKDRYLLTLTGRYDGASVLAEGHKWDFFPSAAVAWKVSEEAFMKDIHWLDQLKLRLGYGVTGNSSVSPYSTAGSVTSTYAKIPFGHGAGSNVDGAKPDVMPNYDLGWEKTSSTNFGIDFTVLNNRIFGSLEYYVANTSDVIMNRSIPVITGYAQIRSNIGKTKNKGFELTLSTVNIKKKDFSWQTDWSFSTNKEKIVELSAGEVDEPGNTWFIGSPLNVFYDYEYDRIWQDNESDKMMMAAYAENKVVFLPGQYKIKDQPMVLCDENTEGAKSFTYNGKKYYYENNGFGTFNNDDKIIYQKTPKWQFGLTNTFTYKDFSLGFFVYGRFGNTYYGLTQTIGRRIENDTWSPTNTGAEFAQPTTASRTTTYDYVRNYTKGNMVVVRNISLSYNLPKTVLRSLSAHSAQVYAQVLNPFLFGGELVKAGINPDDITGWDAANHIGGQTNNTCITRSFVLGVRLGF
jgi:TonB-linked SusC/RagA family outer membrane protein